MVCGLALREAVRSVAGVAATLKWPNDLIVETEEGDGAWRKLAGMLSEVGLADDATPAFLVVGVGINVNVPVAALAGMGARATSLLALTGAPVSRAALLGGLLGRIERRYEAFLVGEDPLPAWRDALAWVGHQVEVRGPRESVTGVLIGVDEEGALLVTLPSGVRRRFGVGDVSLRLGP
jgi:BirA family biotin operon repressor/biotin-[acetyl-CoA-carboxylase] ligase